MTDKLFTTFQTDDNYYLYDTGTNHIIQITKELHDYLNNSSLNVTDIPTTCSSEINELLRMNLLSDKSPNIGFEYNYDILSDIVQSGLSQMCFSLTEDCNLRCKYCIYGEAYESRKKRNPSRMNFSTIQKGLELFCKSSSKTDKLYHLYSEIPFTNRIFVSFYGGEPLLEFDLIEKAVEYANKLPFKFQVRFTITTNLTVANDTILKFLVKNNFLVNISLDGPRNIHDYNRIYPSGTGSWDTVMSNLQKLLQLSPTKFRKNNISFMSVLGYPVNDHERNEFFKQLCHQSNVNGKHPLVSFTSILQEGYDHYLKMINVREDDIKRMNTLDIFRNVLLDKSLKELMKQEPFYFNRFINHLQPLIRRRISKDSWNTQIKIQHSGPCILVMRPLVLCNGDIIPCERIADQIDFVKIGNVADGFNISKIYNLLNDFFDFSKDECKYCWNYKLCNICPSSALNPKTSRYDHSYQKEICKEAKSATYSTLLLFAETQEKRPDIIKYMIDKLDSSDISKI
jgi:uncharacterized protein